MGNLFGTLKESTFIKTWFFSCLNPLKMFPWFTHTQTCHRPKCVRITEKMKNRLSFSPHHVISNLNICKNCIIYRHLKVLLRFYTMISPGFPVLKSDWSSSAPRLLIFSPTAVRHFTVCITLLVCVLSDSQILMLWPLLEVFSLATKQYTK